MKAEHVFTPVILDISKPLTFPEVLSLRADQINARQPAPDMLASPWFQYAERAMSAFHAEGVEESFISFFARALSEAHEMGSHGMQPLKPGQPRLPYRTAGQVDKVVKPIIEHSHRPKAEPAPADPEPDPAPGRAVVRQIRRPDPHATIPPRTASPIVRVKRVDKPAAPARIIRKVK